MRQRKSQNNQLGARFRIQVPKFQFQQAEREFNLVENIMAEHEKNTQEVAQGQNQLKQNGEDQKEGFLPRIQGRQNRSMTYDKQANQQPPKKKSEPQDEFFRLLAENENNSKVFGGSVGGESNKKFQQSEVYEIKPMQDLRPAHKKQQTQHDLKASNPVQLSNTDGFRDSATINNKIDWIDDIHKPQGSKALKKQPARYLDRLDSTKNNQSLNSHRSVGQTHRSFTVSLQDNIEQGEKLFPDMGYNSNKTLRNFDCFQEKLSMDQWLEKCKKSAGPHASCPVYVNKQYQWTDVWVVGYDSESDKFTVKMKNGQLKEVIRLSLLFNEEDPEKFKQRVEFAKLLQNTAADEIRFQKYVEGIKSDMFSQLSASTSENIMQKLFTMKRNITVTDKQVQVNRQKHIEKLLNQVEKEYILFQKKNYVITQMGDYNLKDAWPKLRIKNRYVEKNYNYYGTIEQLAYPYEQVLDYMNRTVLTNQSLITKTFLAIFQKQQQFNQFQLFNYKFDRTELPMALHAYDAAQQKYHENARKVLSIQWREYVINEIQDRLRDQYRFYQTESHKYQDSELSRLLKLADFYFNNFTREYIVNKTITEYCEFLKRFTIPTNQEYDEIWNINSRPLLQINLVVQSIKKKKNHATDKKKKDQTGTEDQQAQTFHQTIKIENYAPTLTLNLDENSQSQQIYYEPNFHQITAGILSIFEKLVVTTNSFFTLEKDLVPLIDVERKPSYQMDISNNEIYKGAEIIMKYLELGFKEPMRILEEFSKYNFLMEESSKKINSALFGDIKEKSPMVLNIDPNLVTQKLEEYTIAKNEIGKLCLDEYNSSFFQIKTRQAKEQLVNRANELINSILTKISDMCTDNSLRIADTYSVMMDHLSVFPKDEKDLVELKIHIQENEVDLAKLKQEVITILKFLDILEKYCFVFPEDKELVYWELYSRPMDILLTVSDANKTLQIQEEKFMQNLEKEKIEFLQELKNLYSEFNNVKQFSDYKEVRNNASSALSLMDQIEKANDKVKNFNERELIFKQGLSEYDDLNKLQAQFSPYYQLWQIAMDLDLDFQDWMNGPFLRMNFATIEKKINQNYFRETVNLMKGFDEMNDTNAGDVANDMKQHIEKFRENLWIIELLTTEAMSNPRRSAPHWKELFREAQLPHIEPNDEMSLAILLNCGLTQHKDIIEDISRKAEKQWGIEKKLKEMEEKVKAQNIELMKFKNTGTYVLKSLEEVQQLLDDMLNIMLMMKASPYIKPLLKQATTLEQKIILIQDTLEEALKCQRGWMYLEPIFISEDIKKKMPLEQKAFEKIDIYWRETMLVFNKEPSIWDNIDSERMKNEFIAHNKSLDIIQKSLSEYLETKRRYFPRFYFLSDEELLEILADTKDPLKVQKHINKCFEAINLLNFTEHQEVVGMISAEKEKVLFNKKIDVNEGDRKGNVEIWLLEIEKTMIDTLVKSTKDCMLDLNTIRTDWVQKWPGQIVLAVNMQRWTQGAEVAIQNGKENSKKYADGFGNQFKNLQEFKEFLIKELGEIVELVRKDLTDLVRMTLGALVVLDVHAKDVIVELEKKDCRSMTDFQWISQLRYYWEEDKKERIMWVKMINAAIRYGFEYLGNSNRLVITPLTDRCYRTLMGAKHLQYGGAPEGPAGTGKTETVKDLAKALAVQCVVFNCSDGLNYLAMRKFFKGLASSGAWCCFDEFNRIDLEVLSVIAQQVLTIQTAIKEKRKVFMFDDEEITLILSCAINITMNPGYAGRSDLPDNLKALFRPCAMMVPDYALIAEIYLYSVGFQDARNLARKVVASLRLSSEQLSSQDHYDFGMRAVKSILTAAGNLKRQMVGELEDIVCLRSLMDVNLPKFTLNDIPLFMSITSDLFPGVKQPEIDYGNLEQALQAICEEKNFQKKSNFLQKCIQLYDTINVRHGLMIVGAAFSGKSSILETLRAGITKLKGIENYVPCVAIKLNPKGVTSDQLYGRLDPDTKSWSDGVVAIIMRNASSDGENAERKWIVFDGPVDAVWIENMNTVLDDNKKLCLTSGEIIKMSNWMTMMFEVEDLSVASPATVSRCGMVFLETQSLGWMVLVQSFCFALPSILSQYSAHFSEYLKWIIDNTLAWCQKHGKFLVHKSEMNMVCSLLKLIGTFLVEFKGENVKVPKDPEENFNQIIMFCTIWSIGAAIEEQSRKGFSDFILHLVTANAEIPKLYNTELYIEYEFEPHAIVHKIPENTSVFEVSFNTQSGQWLNWTQTVEKYLIPKGGEYNQIIVPTIETIRNNYFLNKCIKNKIHLLLCGPTGTGKTANIINEINQNYFNSEYTNLCTSFSGQTKANQVQRLIEGKVSTRRRKGHYGPEEGKANIVIFVDDLNMPAKEVFGAQPPIELLRQWKDHGGWYDLETKEWKFLQDITFIGAMLPSGTQVSMRYLRHYLLLYVQPFENDSLVRIFTNILEWYFMNLQQSPSNAIRAMRDTVVKSTILLYNQVQNSKELLPTPAKSHYIYNLRDISKVFQGICKASSKSYRDDSDFIKLWANECERVFRDRLINVEDQGVFSQMLKKIVSQNFRKEWDELIEVQPLMWASFVPCVYPEGDTSKKPYNDVYCEITDRELLEKKCHQYLSEYNQFYQQNRMNLVLFMSALSHIVKIVRIITTSFGHALLVGVGGSGRKSLATLSSFIAFQNETFQIDPKVWVDDLQKVMKTSGLDEKEVIFLFSDTQIQKEAQLEDICNILNKGEVPNLFPIEEKAKILEDVSITGTPNEKFQYFVSQCKKNLHLVLTFSPVGEAFRRRLRTFPALVNCTTIDWFLPWPEDALRSTANNHFINEMAIKQENIRNSLVEIAVDMQTRISVLSQRYIDELRRYYYVTPTSYLELLATFKLIVDDRTQKVDKQIKRYETGVNKILDTEVVVEKMQEELKELQPLLIEKTKANQEMLANLQVKQKHADEQREICEAEERDCTVIKDEANILREDCQGELDKVVPLLLGAAQALDKITKDDMNTLKSFVAPPVSAALIMEGLCYAFDEDKHVKWIAKPDGKPGEKIQDFWDYSKKKLLNDKLIKRVKDFKEDLIRTIPEKNIDKLKVFVKNPLFEKEKVFNASKAAGNLSLWVRAVVDTYGALLVVDPKKEQLAVAEGKLKAAEDILTEKKRQLQEVMDLLAALQGDYDRAKKEKEDLEFKVNKCKVQLERAGKLISGLGGEKNAWSEKAIKFKQDANNVVGDSLMSSGIIAYLGAFPIQYRDQTIQQWKELFLKQKIIFSPDYSLQNILSDQITIGQWTNTFKLPNDSFSIDNAIILKNSSRWPLMIDPQTQANTWVKKLEQTRNLKILRTTQSFNELILQLESSIQFGFPVLLENVTEDIDQLFEPILQKKLIKQGGSFKLKFGDKFIDYSPEFSFYMTTKLPRPHYPPEICVKVTLLNFQVTPLGLEDQMTNIVVQIEEPIKDRQRQANIEEFFNNKEKQRQTEDLILKLLNDSSGNLLDDEKLILTLQTSKIESNEIEEALKKQEHFQIMFEGIRKHYNPVAQRVSNLYFVILDMALIEPTYQWSLEFYIVLFIKSIEKAIKDKENRIKNIIEKFQEMLYDSICRSLLEKDKLIFSLLMCQKILEIKQKVNANLIRFLMVGGTLTDAPKPIPENSEWLSNKQWCTICEMDQVLPEFNGFLSDFECSLPQWKKLYDHDDPINQPLPGKWENIHIYQKMIIYRTLYPSKFARAVLKLIEFEMGHAFISPPPFDLEFSIQDGTPFTPFIFILSPGADPRLEILNTAEKLGKKSSFMQISLGQGQGAMAESSIKLGAAEGRWVLLQNCHLAPSFMPSLERILETMEQNKETIHTDFRIWLTSMPSEIFPPVILMKGIKMTYEPPRGMKNNLIRVFSTQDKKTFEDCDKLYQWKKLFFGLAFFHGLILERRQFGPLGWNIPYEFTMADFTISYSQLKMFLNEYDDIPWEALNYMVAEANYGGRVTDSKDRRLINVILKDFYTIQALEENYKYSKSGIYYSPNEGDLNEYIDFINQLPMRQDTEVFGLHPNAAISSAIIETNSICDTVLSLLPRSTGGGGKSAESTIKEKCKEILGKLPSQFDLDLVKKKMPVLYEESMNTVLQQELIRFNKLLNTIRISVVNLSKAIDGLLVMSNDLEKVFDSLFNNKQPQLWQKHSYPSLKPLGAYLNNFIERLQFMQKWIDEGSPASYWISGFYFTQSFLTGTLQNYARKHKIPIDTLAFDFIVLDSHDDQYDTTKTPDDGCFIYGLFFDGARWDTENKCINESIPKQLYSEIPYIYLVPSNEKRDYDTSESLYCSPCYKTSLRRGTLSTTGHSTNFVMDMYLPIHPDTYPDYWVKMGVAAITQLDD